MSDDIKVYEYTCGICKVKQECSEPVPDHSGEGDILLCPDCQETIHALTGVSFDE